MAKKGYVHRDVSAGNILWFGDHAKLSDLEFAREYGTGGSSDARTVCTSSLSLFFSFLSDDQLGHL